MMEDVDTKSLLKGASQLPSGALVDDHPNGFRTHGHNNGDTAKDAIRGFIAADQGPPIAGPPSGGPPLGGPPPMGGFNYAMARPLPGQQAPKPAVEVPMFKVFNPAEALAKEKESPREGSADPAQFNAAQSEQQQPLRIPGDVNPVAVTLERADDSALNPAVNPMITGYNADSARGNSRNNPLVPENVQRQRARNAKARSQNGQNAVSDTGNSFHSYNAPNISNFGDDLSRPQNLGMSVYAQDEEYEADYYSNHSTSSTNAGTNHAVRRSNSGSVGPPSGPTRRRSSSSNTNGVERVRSGDRADQNTKEQSTPDRQTPIADAAKASPVSALDFGVLYNDKNNSASKPALQTENFAGQNPAFVQRTESRDSNRSQSRPATAPPPTTNPISSSNAAATKAASMQQSGTPVRTSSGTVAAAAQKPAKSATGAPTATTAGPTKRVKSSSNNKKLSSVRPKQLQDEIQFYQREKNVSLFERYLVFVNVCLSLGIIVTLIALVTIVLVFEYNFPLVEVANDVSQQCTQVMNQVSQQSTLAQHHLQTISREYAPWLGPYLAQAKHKTYLYYRHAVFALKNSKEMQHLWALMMAYGYTGKMYIANICASGCKLFAQILAQISQEIAQRM
jgi:hypothetical protein